jgi:putative cardiolipin synthase
LTRIVTALLALVLLAGCAGLPSPVERPVSITLTAPADAPLAAVAREARLGAGESGFRAMPQASFALEARLELMRRAKVSLDLQCYLIGADATGRLVLRELAEAAARGVRVRLLLDDLYAKGLDELLLGLAAHPNVEVRLFNPFAYGREPGLVRLWHLATDFHRLNHRMHNKLFIADGVMAVAGGRNLADEYFLRSTSANFIDFDVLATGAIVPELAASFDTYWNSEQVFPLGAVASSRLDSEALRAAFARAITPASGPAPDPPPPADVYGDPPLAAQLDAHAPRLVVARAGSLADRPEKIVGIATETVTERYFSLLREAEREVILISPYFVPGADGLERLRELRARGIEVRVVTNATSSSDEPLVNVGLSRYRVDLLRMGVRLYEVESLRLKRDEQLRGLLGSTAGRLHAKLALIDRQRVLVGSMNVDPRSSRTNTELGIGVRSAELAQRVLSAYRLDAADAVYELRLKPDGDGIEWIGRNGRPGGDLVEEHLDTAPQTGWLQRLRLFLLGLFVPEDLL